MIRDYNLALRTYSVGAKPLCVSPRMTTRAVLEVKVS